LICSVPLFLHNGISPVLTAFNVAMQEDLPASCNYYKIGLMQPKKGLRLKYPKEKTRKREKGNGDWLKPISADERDTGRGDAFHHHYTRIAP
jgi:hypothetical protein